MKLAEALILRADAQKRVNELKNRMARVARLPEGETPAEDPLALLAEADGAIASFTNLVQRINRTNATTLFDATRTLTDVLAERDGLALQRNVIAHLIAQTGEQPMRYGRMEIKYVATVDMAALQRRADSLAQQYRELDTAIQQMNWSIDLVE